MTDLGHDRCSELLETYVSGELDADQRRAVDEHLAVCSDCSLELVAVQTLTEPVVPMTGIERDELTRAVRAGIASPQKRSLSERFGRRLAPALGAVALFALAAIAVVSLPEDPPSPNAGGGTDAGVTMESEADEMQPGTAQKDQAETTEDSMSGTTTGTGSAGGGAAGDAARNSGSATTLESNAAQVGRASFIMEPATFAAAGISLPNLVPSRRNIEVLEDDAATLARAAPNERVAELIRDCAERTIATSPHPLVPSTAVYYADDVLVIGFIWVDPSTSQVNFEVRGWTNGRCDQVSPIYRRGALE